MSVIFHKGLTRCCAAMKGGGINLLSLCRLVRGTFSLVNFEAINFADRVHQRRGPFAGFTFSGSAA